MDGTPCGCKFPHVCDTRVREETVEAKPTFKMD